MASHPVLRNQQELLNVLDGFETFSEAGLDLEVDQLDLLELWGVGELGKVYPDTALLQAKFLKLAEFRDSFEEAAGRRTTVPELQQQEPEDLHEGGVAVGEILVEQLAQNISLLCLSSPFLSLV